MARLDEDLGPVGADIGVGGGAEGSNSIGTFLFSVMITFFQI